MKTKQELLEMYRATGSLYHPNWEGAVKGLIKRDIRKATGEQFDREDDDDAVDVTAEDERADIEAHSGDRGPRVFQWGNR